MRENNFPFQTAGVWMPMERYLKRKFKEYSPFKEDTYQRFSNNYNFFDNNSVLVI